MVVLDICQVVLASSSSPNLVLAPIYLRELGDSVVDAETVSPMSVPSAGMLQRAETMPYSNDVLPTGL